MQKTPTAGHGKVYNSFSAKFCHVGASLLVASASTVSLPALKSESSAGETCSGLISLNLGRPAKYNNGFEECNNGFDTELLSN